MAVYKTARASVIGQSIRGSYQPPERTICEHSSLLFLFSKAHGACVNANIVLEITVKIYMPEIQLVSDCIFNWKSQQNLTMSNNNSAGLSKYPL